ncbi:MAG: sigma-70 family RNA polymerase sigma factor [Clostridia bacterium]|nr:sigma-70 family RNA polymerase sigma factor [Clostridia bacterium]
MGIDFVENYENLSDNELVSLINQGNYELLQIIISRYYSTILYYVKKYCPENHREDAVQEAIFALYSAVKSFDSAKSSFSTFASLCIKRAVISVLKGQRCKRNIPDELLSPIDGLEIIDSNSPEKIFFDREDYKTLTDTIKLELSKLEYEVLQLYLSGANYSDIALRLSITEKAVDNSLTRIRRKLKGK